MKLLKSISFKSVVLRVVLAAAISLAIYFPFDDRLFLSEISDTLAEADHLYLVLSLLFGFLAAGFRIWRLAVALAEPFNIRVAVLSVLHNLAVMLLPMRLGEVVLPVLLKKAQISNLLSGVGILFVVRVCDGLVILVLGGIGAAFTTFTSPGYEQIWLLGWIIAALSLVCSLVWPVLVPLTLALFDLKNSRLSDSISEFFKSVESMRTYAKIWGITLLVHLSFFSVFYFAALSLDAATSVPGTALGSFAGAIAFALPLNGIANLGPLQAAWAFVMNLQGIPWGLAFAAGILIHIVILAANLLITGFMLIAYFSSRRR